MAKLKLTAAHPLGSIGNYKKFKKWIGENFYYNICAYCLTTQGRTTLDHYVPVVFDSSKKHDSTNLTSACDVCQSPSHKWDYHHQNTNHKRIKKFPANFPVHDVRNEDIESIFQLDLKTGRIEKKNRIFLGTARAEFLLSLFGMDLATQDDPRNDDRLHVIQIMNNLEKILLEKHKLTSEVYKGLDSYLRKLARNEIWLYCMGIKLPSNIIVEMKNRKIERSKAM